MIEILLAHHPALAAIPFLVPVLVLGAAIAVLALRQRRR